MLVPQHYHMGLHTRATRYGTSAFRTVSSLLTCRTDPSTPAALNTPLHSVPATGLYCVTWTGLRVDTTPRWWYRLLYCELALFAQFLDALRFHACLYYACSGYRCVRQHSLPIRVAYYPFVLIPTPTTCLPI